MNSYIDIFTLIAFCVIFFVLETIAPVKEFLKGNNKNHFLLLSAAINLIKVILIVICLFYIESWLVTLICVMFIINMVVDIFLLKNESSMNYMLLGAFVIYLFIRLFN